MAQSISQEAIGATGLPGATAASRHAGATTSGAPTTGTFAVGDFIVDQSGAMYVCTVAGTPGTWGIVGTPPTAQIAGKNKIINGDFSVWQRGTTFTIGASGYDSDRWQYAVASAVPTGTITQQTFTPGTAPVSGYEGTYYKQYLVTANNGCTLLQAFMKMEDVRLFANQTVTLSFWAKADGVSSGTATFGQNFGTGGSAEIDTAVGTFNLTTAWQRFSFTVTLPSIAGKTIGTSSSLILFLNIPNSGSNVRNGTYSFWGFQLEAGNLAGATPTTGYPTEFTTASGSIGGELALCYRYYYRTTAYNQTTGSTYVYSQLSTANVASSAGQIYLQPMVPVAMRTNPTALDYNLSNIGAFAGGVSRIAITSISIASGNQFFPGVVLNSSTNSFTQGQTYVLQDQGSGNGYLGISAEL